MNASDIIKKKQNAVLYKAYYNPVVYQSTVFSTLNSYSTISSGTASYTSTVNTVDNYICPPHILSYNLINGILEGKVSSGDKTIAEVQWKNTNSTIQYYYSTTNLITSSYVLSGPTPIICNDLQLICGSGAGGGGDAISGENASDIVSAKRDGELYKAYYTPRIFSSTIVSTLIPFSSISSGTTTYTSTTETIYTYTCNPTFVSYQTVNSVNSGAYICGPKQLSVMDWKNTNSSIQFYFSTSGSGDISTITSTFVLRGPQPVICPLVELYQGPQTLNGDCSCYQTCTDADLSYCEDCDSGS
jgi:hypothetical protein